MKYRASLLAALAVNLLPLAAAPLKKPETFTNKGMVAFGMVPSNARDSTGTTIGGIGSAIAIKRQTWSKAADGSYSGIFVVQPDRGYNVEGTVDYQARQHEFLFKLTPHTNSAPLSFSDAQKTLTLSYKSTLLYTERKGKTTTGLDALSVRPAQGQDPVMPLPSTEKDNLSVDAEGLALNADGSFWVGDEYGPYIYKFNPDGALSTAIQPPRSIVPVINGAVNFTSTTDPDFGRAPNKGFEAVTASPDGKALYAMLQAALVQDGGAQKDHNNYVHMFRWDVSQSSPKLTGEWVVPLPQTSKGKTIEQNEIHYLDGNKFLVLARDGNGHGDDDPKSKYKSIDYFDVSGATNIAGSKYDGSKAVAPGGTLHASVTPAQYTQFLSLIDNKQLARFGLHNGGNSDSTLINAKWESIALAPVQDPSHPDDYFVFTAADNDFITLNGTMVGQPYSSSYGQNVDNQFLVSRVTLPGLPACSVAQSIGVNC